ncbi:MAG TPA: ABC transporter permease [Chloroflexota bacterium]|nr:ABC transporter permease [Chloroflexota bacterium]
MTDTVATGAAAGRSGERVAAAPAVEVTAPVAPRRATQGIGFYHRAWNKLRRDPVTLAAAAVLGAIVVITLLAPLITQHVLHTTPEQMVRGPDGRFAVLKPPGVGYPLGTDDLGRDVLTRLLHAGQVSLTIGFLVALISIVVGTSAGLVAGYFGGWVDDLLNAVIQLVFNLPFLFVLIILSVLLRPNVVTLSLIFAFFFWPSTARQVRAVVLSARSLDYVMAAEVLGARSWRIMVRHILPNVANIVMVVAGFDVAAAILTESGLSFLGFGVQVPLASWGNMLSGSQEMFRRAPWLVYPPGVMIFLTVLCVVLVADGLRDALDPRVK